MTNKKQKKLTYAEITEKIDSLQFSEKSKSKDSITLTNAFCKLKDVKDIKESEIEILLNTCIVKVDNDYWKFLLDVFSRLFYKASVTKNKAVDKILFHLGKVIEKKFDGYLDRNVLNKVINENGKIEYIKAYISGLQKSTEFEQNEYIALIFMLLLLIANKLLGQDKINGIRNIEKAIFELYGVPDKNDKFYIKQITKSLIENKAAVLFYSFIGMYEGTTLRIANLEDENAQLKSIVRDRNQDIALLNSSITQLRNQIEVLSQQIEDKISEIVTLQKDLEAGTNRNEYNENLYKKQYETLKKGFIEKLKKDLQLEIQGLEDLADLLPDSSRSKIQRRIDNIYKIIQKAGE